MPRDPLGPFLMLASGWRPSPKRNTDIVESDKLQISGRLAEICLIWQARLAALLKHDLCIFRLKNLAS